jgi:3-oxosteroid 1-dehydrogenase
MPAPAEPESTVVDVVVVGSGAAALTASLTAAVGGLSVVVLEKSDRIGGTSAMSGGGTWIPANHVARAAGVADSREEALTYLRAALPEGWREREEPLWRAFVGNAPDMLEFVEKHSPLRYELIPEPDPMAEQEGGKAFGRMLSPRPISRSVVGTYASKIRRSTLPHIFTYREMMVLDPYHSPVGTVLRLLPELFRRWLTGARGQGNALVTGLLKGCLDKGVRIELGTPVKSLIQDESDRVIGVRAERNGKPLVFHGSRGVLLATGGFEWNEEMREKYFPGPFDRIGSPDTNRGDGQIMANQIGAKLDNMDQANVFPTIPTRYEGRLHGMPTTWQAEPHAIMVGRDGNRFVSEYDYNIGEALDRRDPRTGEPLHLPAWLIADSRFFRQAIPLRWYASYDPNWVRRADTVEALAEQIGLPPNALAATVARFNDFCAAGRDEDFHRGESVWERYQGGMKDGETGNVTLGPIERAPFLAIPINRSTVGTKGGVRTNSRGQALRNDGEPIPGLFCAGNVMANPIGTRAVGAGTTIGPVMTWGYICARTMLGNRPPEA